MPKIQMAGIIRSRIQASAAAITMLFAFATLAQANVRVSPERVNFGSESVGSLGATHKVTITNENRHKITISGATSSTAQFSISEPSWPVVLNPGQSLTVEVKFKPSAAKSYFGSLEFERSGGSTISVRLRGTGSGQVTPSSPVAPTISTEPANVKITAGQSATFNIAATGTAPMTYKWMKNGVAIDGATSSNYTTPAESTADNNAQFTVEVSNSVGNTMSTAAVLTVTTASVAPAITTQPASETVIAGKPASFSVAATGTAPLTFQWSKNGTPIGGANSSTYTTAAETTADNSAKFTVEVSNSAGNATSNAAVLTVTNASVVPTITTQPASQTVIAGNSATFTVAAAGTGPLTYQWSKNGTPIGGANGTNYTTPAETTTDNNAKFTVAVSNSAGNATSNAATLTVSASTLILNSSASSLNFGSVTLPNVGTQTVTLTNAGNSSVTITNVTVSGAGFNATGVAGLILTAGQKATLTATFTPSGAGPVTGSISVVSTASNSPDSISLSGTGIAAPASHSVALTWSPSVSMVIGYNAYSSQVSGGPYTKMTSTPVPTTSYTDNSVLSGQTYFFVVTSVDSNNLESAFSTEASALVP